MDDNKNNNIFENSDESKESYINSDNKTDSEVSSSDSNIYSDGKQYDNAGGDIQKEAAENSVNREQNYNPYQSPEQQNYQQKDYNASNSYGQQPYGQQYTNDPYSQQNQNQYDQSQQQQYNQQQYGQQPYNQQPQYTQQYQYNQYVPKPESPSKGMGIASLVLGIASFLCCTFGPLTAIPGLILGIIARNKDSNNGIALAGIIVSAIGLAISILLIILFLVTDMNEFYSEFWNEFNNSHYNY